MKKLDIDIINQFYLNRDFTCGAVVENTPANAGDTGDLGSIPGSGRSHGEGNGNRILAWRIPWTEETDGLQSMRSQTVKHD